MALKNQQQAHTAIHIYCGICPVKNGSTIPIAINIAAIVIFKIFFFLTIFFLISALLFAYNPSLWQAAHRHKLYE